MKKPFLTALTAFAAMATTSVASAQKSPVERSVLEQLTMVPLVPGGAFHVSKVEAEQLVTFGCTFGPTGAFKEPIDEDMSPCSEKAIDAKRKAVKAGGFVYDIRRVGSMFVYTMTDQGMSRNVNFKCQFNVLSNGQVSENQCVNTANGKMMFDAVAATLIGQGGAMAIGAIAANLTAPRAGNSTIAIDNGSVSGSQANSKADSTGGGGGTNIFNVSATGGQGGTAGASSNSAANLTGGCTTGVCGQTPNPSPH